RGWCGTPVARSSSCPCLRRGTEGGSPSRVRPRTAGWRSPCWPRGPPATRSAWPAAGFPRPTIRTGRWRARRCAPCTPSPARAAGAPVRLAGGGLPPRARPHGAMARAALRDLHTLTGPEGTAPGAVLAGASPAWMFVWPRDASFAAAALARTGHSDDALTVLLHLQGLQGADGSFQARYLPDGTGDVPDDRLPQEDGPGWALWATRVLVEESAVGPGPPEPSVLLGDLIARSAARLLHRIDPATGLPRPPPAYREPQQENDTH